jgi:hypothetical protein
VSILSLTRVFAAVVLLAVGSVGPATAHGRFATFGAGGMAAAATSSKRVVYYQAAVQCSSHSPSPGFGWW